jgi:hypothetical protein
VLGLRTALVNDAPVSNRKPHVPRADRPAPRNAGRPEPGYYELSLTKGAPTVGARIEYGPPEDPENPGEFLDRSWYWRTTIDSEPDPKPSPAPTEATWRVWHARDMKPINERRYRFLLEDRAWARKYAPDSPEANPKRRPNAFTDKLIF